MAVCAEVTVYVTNRGEIPWTFWVGMSRGRGPSGSGCGIGLDEVIDNLSVDQWPSITLSPGERGSVIWPGNTGSVLNPDEVIVAKVYSIQDPDPANCKAGVWAPIVVDVPAIIELSVRPVTC